MGSYTNRGSVGQDDLLLFLLLLQYMMAATISDTAATDPTAMPAI